MLKDFLETILDYWSQTFYTQPLVIPTAIFALHKLLGKKPKSPLSRLFILYLSSVILLLFGSNILVASGLMSVSASNFTIEIANNVFNTVEAYVFMVLLYFFTQSKTRRKQIRILFYLNIFLTLIGFPILFGSSSEHDTFKWAAISSLIHFFTIVVPCFWCFYDIYRSNIPIMINQVSIVLSITSYSLLSIPVFAIIEYSHIKKYDSQLYIIHYTCLAVVCFSFWYNSRKNSEERFHPHKNHPELKTFMDRSQKHGKIITMD